MKVYKIVELSIFFFFYSTKLEQIRKVLHVSGFCKFLIDYILCWLQTHEANLQIYKIGTGS